MREEIDSRHFPAKHCTFPTATYWATFPMWPYIMCYRLSAMFHRGSDAGAMGLGMWLVLFVLLYGFLRLIEYLA